jgi:hypothetical protein
MSLAEQFKLGKHPSLHCIVSLEQTNFNPEHIEGSGCILPEDSGKHSPKACCNEPKAKKLQLAKDGHG